MANFFIIGAGSWGTAVALMLSHNGHAVKLWSHEKAHCDAMRTDRCNKAFLPNHPFPELITITDDLPTEDDPNTHVMIAVPSHAFRRVIEQLPQLKHISWITKGLDPKTGQFLSDIVIEHWGKQTQMTLITGPSFAIEVADHHPTAVILAANNPEYGKLLQDLVHNKYFRTYLSNDLLGAQIGGAVKNIMAIAVGIADGLGFGRNTQAMLITRALAEMLRLGEAIGAHKETLMGLSGLGDLILTCSDDKSRNRRFGKLLGQGKSTQEAFETVQQVVEGYQTTQLVYQFKQNLNISTPIIDAMYALLYQNKPINSTVEQLLSRHVREEF